MILIYKIDIKILIKLVFTNLQSFLWVGGSIYQSVCRNQHSDPKGQNFSFLSYPMYTYSSPSCYFLNFNSAISLLVFNSQVSLSLSLQT